MARVHRPPADNPFPAHRRFLRVMDCEQAPLLGFVREAARFLDKRFRPDGYSIGVNVGEAAGQTVMHLHVHVIPRYAGDMASDCLSSKEHQAILKAVLPDNVF